MINLRLKDFKIIKVQWTSVLPYESVNNIKDQYRVYEANEKMLWEIFCKYLNIDKEEYLYEYGSDAYKVGLIMMRRKYGMLCYEGLWNYNVYYTPVNRPEIYEDFKKIAERENLKYKHLKWARFGAWSYRNNFEDGEEHIIKLAKRNGELWSKHKIVKNEKERT